MMEKYPQSLTETLQKILDSSCPECKGEKKIYGIFSVWNCRTCESIPAVFNLGEELSADQANLRLEDSACQQLTNMYDSLDWDAGRIDVKFFYGAWMRSVHFVAGDVKIFTWSSKDQKWLTQEELIDAFSEKNTCDFTSMKLRGFRRYEDVY